MMSVYEELVNQKMTNANYFFQWLPDSIKCTYNKIPPVGFDSSCTFIGQHSGVIEPIKRLGIKFTTLFRRKAYLHWYTQQGMDEMEFTEAESDLNDMASEYDGAGA